ncbi:MAG TPA: hypothetical protein VN442_25315 [Bryobacteraceae bacterium]|nr:hypothetical protein [Bryobacteraceae bacterium]
MKLGPVAVPSVRLAPEGQETASRKRGEPRPKIREASLADYPQIAALHIRNGLPIEPRDDWNSLWSANPAFRKGWPIGWVAETERHGIVGSLGNVPQDYRFEGRELHAAASRGWVTDASYRGYSMALRANFLAQREVDLFISTSVGRMAEACYRFFGCSRVPVGEWDRSEFWIANHRQFASWALKMGSVPLPAPLGYPLSLTLRCREWWVNPRRRTAPEFHLELHTGFDAAFDDFWRELTTQNKSVLTAVRTREALGWHFRRSLARKEAWIFTASVRDRMVAYAVFDRRDSVDGGLRRVRLVDFQALNGYQNALAAALDFALSECRRDEVHLLESTGCLASRVDPAIHAPYRRKLPSWTYYYKAGTARLSNELANPAVWAPSQFDGDVAL